MIQKVFTFSRGERMDESCINNGESKYSLAAARNIIFLLLLLLFITGIAVVFVNRFDCETAVSRGLGLCSS